MTGPRHHEYSFADYVALQRDSSVKHEFLDGEIYAMAGGTPEHAALAVSVAASLLQQLWGGPCRVYSSDLNVRVQTTGLATYPDVTVVCGPVQRDAEHANAVTNAKVVVEVTSRSTETYDRGQKPWHFQQAPTIEAVVIVSHRERRIDVWSRASSGWTHAEFRSEATARADCIDCTLDVDDVYGAAEEPPAPL
jgi:Uma2 family endonuclease